MPAFGPDAVDPSGAVLVGSRAPLVAFNVALDGPLEVAREVAAAVRASSGGLPGVQALGLQLGDGTVQVSTNVVDLDATAPHELVERIVGARPAGAASAVGAGELVGLLPAASVADAAARGGRRGRRSSTGCRPTRRSRRRRAALRLPRLEPDRVLEWHVSGSRAGRAAADAVRSCRGLGADPARSRSQVAR